MYLTKGFVGGDLLILRASLQCPTSYYSRRKPLSISNDDRRECSRQNSLLGPADDLLETLFTRLKKGVLTKNQFIEAMHPCHRLLFQYADRLRDNIIDRVIINPDGVEVRTRFGVRLACDPEDVYNIPLGALSLGAVENAEGNMLMSLFPQGGVFFDVGANVGWYTTHAAVKNPTSRIWAFEPMPATYRWLTRNIALNNLENVSALNTGLGEENGELTFFFRPDMTGAASAANITSSEKAMTVRAPIRRLDDCWREIGANPDLIKCDVEGYELFVFRGGRECIAQALPVVFCEMLRKWSAKFGYTPNDIIAFFGELGYGCYEVDGTALRPFAIMTEETVGTNFFFLHREKHKAILSERTTA